MRAFLITNKYYVSESFLKLKKLLFTSAEENDIDFVEYNNVDIIKILSNKEYEKPDFVLFWNKDVKLALYLENEGIRVFNSSDSIRISDDKALTYLRLRNKGIRQAKTYMSPLLYYDHSIVNENEILDYIISDLGLPFVFKECAGSFGQQVFLINSREELVSKIGSVSGRPYIMQEFIKTSYGRDLRIYVVGDKVVAAMKRQNISGDFRANIEAGGVGEKYIPNELETEVALKAAKCIGLDFCGVDLLFGENDERILCEVNSNAYFNELDKISNVKIEDEIFNHILKSISWRN